jgi:hypothetical protein
MREVVVRLTFTKHCLGNVKKQYWENGKRRSFFVFPRNQEGQVLFMPTWWRAVLSMASQALCRHQTEVSKIRFCLEIAGSPRAIPDEFYRRYSSEKAFSKHEAFYPGDSMSVTCLVPDSIDDEELRSLLEIAGKYYGISPARPNEYGNFVVESVVAENKESRECS